MSNSFTRVKVNVTITIEGFGYMLISSVAGRII